MENNNLLDEIDPFEDEAFLKELQSRLEDIESGKTKGLSWEEVTCRAEAELKKRRNTIE